MVLSSDNIHPCVYSCKGLKATLNAAFLHNTEQGQIYTYTGTMHANTSKHLIEKQYVCKYEWEGNQFFLTCVCGGSDACMWTYKLIFTGEWMNSCLLCSQLTFSSTVARTVTVFLFWGNELSQHASLSLFAISLFFFSWHIRDLKSRMDERLGWCVGGRERALIHLMLGNGGSMRPPN